MASPSYSNSQLGQHLADRALTPIISSANNPSSNSRSSQIQSEALSTLTSTAIAAFEAASKLGLGVPQRIMVETLPGPIILHSFLSPQSQRPRSQHPTNYTNHNGIIEQAREEHRALSVNSESVNAADEREDRVGTVNGLSNGEISGEGTSAELDDEAENSLQQPPMLIASVIAPGVADLREARRAATRLERTGRDLQKEWTKHQNEGHEDGHGEDG